MAQHKRPTEVSIAPTSEETPFHEWVRRYWAAGLAVALLCAALVLWRVNSQQEQSAQGQESWNHLREAMDLQSPQFSLQMADVAALESAATELKGTVAGPWARALEAQKRMLDSDFSGAQGALDALRRDYPRHELLTRAYSFREGEAALSLVDHLENCIASQRSFRDKNPGLFGNPPLPADAPRVRLNTSKGSIVVGLYSQIAPKHSENFLKLASEGFYTGTKFHRITKGMMVQGGDPNSKTEDTASWGQGGPGYDLEPEKSALRHFKGALSTAKVSGASVESGSQFFLTTGNVPGWDGQYTVFGAVLEGQGVLDLLQSAALAEGSADRPADPIAIDSVEIL